MNLRDQLMAFFGQGPKRPEQGITNGPNARIDDATRSRALEWALCQQGHQ